MPEKGEHPRRDDRREGQCRAGVADQQALAAHLDVDALVEAIISIAAIRAPPPKSVGTGQSAPANRSPRARRRPRRDGHERSAQVVRAARRGGTGSGRCGRCGCRGRLSRRTRDEPRVQDVRRRALVGDRDLDDGGVRRHRARDNCGARRRSHDHDCRGLNTRPPRGLNGKFLRPRHLSVNQTVAFATKPNPATRSQSRSLSSEPRSVASSTKWRASLHLTTAQRAGHPHSPD